MHSKLTAAFSNNDTARFLEILKGFAMPFAISGQVDIARKKLEDPAVFARVAAETAAREKRDLNQTLQAICRSARPATDHSWWISRLLVAGADPKANQNLAIREAIGNSELKISTIDDLFFIVYKPLWKTVRDPVAGVGATIDFPKSNDNEFLRIACNRGGIVVVERLLEMGADLESTTKHRPLFNAIRNGHLHLIKHFLALYAAQNHPVPTEAFEVAACANQPEAMAVLFNAKNRPSSDELNEALARSAKYAFAHQYGAVIYLLALTGFNFRLAPEPKFFQHLHAYLGKTGK